VASRSSKIIGDRQAGNGGPTNGAAREDASPNSANSIDRSPRDELPGAPRSAKRSRLNTNEFSARPPSATETPSPRPHPPPTPSSSSHTGRSTAGAADLATVRSMLSSIRSNLESVEKAVPALASASSAVPEATGRDLRWADLAPHLPSPDDCMTLFQCFFSEVSCSALGAWARTLTAVHSWTGMSRACIPAPSTGSGTSCRPGIASRATQRPSSTLLSRSRWRCDRQRTRRHASRMRRTRTASTRSVRTSCCSHKADPRTLA
jgi:hypothetical protein